MQLKPISISRPAKSLHDRPGGHKFFTAGRVVANSDLLTVLPRHFVKVTGIEDELVLRDLPFAVPTVHVDALWHHRVERDGAHEWLRKTVAGLALKTFA